MHSLSSSGMVYQGWRSVADSGPVANWIGGVGGVFVYITQYGGRSACRPIVTVSFWLSGMPSHSATTFLAAASAWPLPLMFVCPRILCNIVGSHCSALYRRESTIAVMSGLWWWYVVCVGRCSSFRMAWRLVWESVNMPTHWSCLYLSRATYMAASSALVMACVSS